MAPTHVKMPLKENELYVLKTCGRLTLKSFGMSFIGSVVRTFTPFYFLVEPMDILSVRGASVIMNCSSYCETPPKIEWKKDGTLLNLVSDDRRQLLPDGSLLINSVVHSKHNKPDEGYYQCVATVESLGSIVSRTAKLTVAGKDLVFSSSTTMSTIMWMCSIAIKRKLIPRKKLVSSLVNETRTVCIPLPPFFLN